MVNSPNYSLYVVTKSTHADTVFHGFSDPAEKYCDRLSTMPQTIVWRHVWSFKTAEALRGGGVGVGGRVSVPLQKSAFSHVPQNQNLDFYVPCSPNCLCSPVPLSFLTFVPLFLLNEWPYSPIPQNPWEGLTVR